MDSTVDVDDILFESPTTQFGRVMVLGAVSMACRFTMTFMNRTTVKNAEALRLLQDREAGQPLITVSNHTSTIDDPCLPCAILPWDFHLREANHQRSRWVFCAEDVCFKNAVYRSFFQSGKVLPVKRGGGVEQPALQMMARRLAGRGDWLHVFPEGRISYDGRVSDLRRGVGRMVCDVARHGRTPIVLPFYHSGMGNVMPYQAMWPRWGHNVFVTFGDPVQLDDLVCKCNQKENQEAVWQQITERIHNALLELEVRTVANVDQVKTGAAPQRHVHHHNGETSNDL